MVTGTALSEMGITNLRLPSHLCLRRREGHCEWQQAGEVGSPTVLVGV